MHSTQPTTLPETSTAPLSATAQVLGLAAWMAICFVAAGVGSGFTASEIGSWYTQINKPTWNPPNWIFPVVWTTLFAMMGISAWLVWRQYPRTKVARALAVFLLQLALNVFWSILFFGLHQVVWAGIEILVLLLAIVATIRFSWPISRPAAWLLVPYALWVSFASYLNWTIVSLNN